MAGIAKRKVLDVLVTVTKDDIRKGEPKTGFRCPIALAIRRKVKRIGEVHVGSEITVGEDYATVTPYRCNQFIKRFDDGQMVKPFVFHLKLKEFDEKG